MVHGMDECLRYIEIDKSKRWSFREYRISNDKFRGFRNKSITSCEVVCKVDNFHEEGEATKLRY